MSAVKKQGEQPQELKFDVAAAQYQMHLERLELCERYADGVGYNTQTYLNEVVAEIKRLFNFFLGGKYQKVAETSRRNIFSYIFPTTWPASDLPEHEFDVALGLKEKFVSLKDILPPTKKEPSFQLILSSKHTVATGQEEEPLRVRYLKKKIQPGQKIIDYYKQMMWKLSTLC